MANNVNRTITTTLKLAGEAEYKNQLKQINAESKNLDASMKELKTRFDGNTESAEYLAEKQKILAEETKNAEAKVKVLTDAYNEAKETQQKYADKAAELREKLDNLKKTEGDTSEEQKKLNEQLKDAEEQAQRAANTAQQYDTRIKNAQASVNGFANEQKKLNDELNGGSKAAEEAGDKNVKLGGSFDVASAGATALISTGIIKFFNELREELNETIKGAANYADEMNTLSAQYGVSTHDLQVFAYASELVDVDLNTMTSSLSRNVRAMKSAQDGTASYVDAYKKLGVSVTNADGSLRDSEEVYWEVIDALGKMENQTEADSIAMTLMGRSAMQLNPLIKVGKEGMEAYAKQAEEAGAVLSDDVLDTLNKLQDAEDTQAANLDALKNQLGSTFAPELTKIKEAEAAILENVTAFIKENPELVKAITGIVGILGGYLTIKLAINTAQKAYMGMKALYLAAIGSETAAVEGEAAAYGKLALAKQSANGGTEAAKGIAGFLSAYGVQIAGAIGGVAVAGAAGKLSAGGDPTEEDDLNYYLNVQRVKGDAESNRNFREQFIARYGYDPEDYAPQNNGSPTEASYTARLEYEQRLKNLANDYNSTYETVSADIKKILAQAGVTETVGTGIENNNNNAEIVSAVLTALRNKYAEAAEDEKELISQSIVNIEKWRDAQVSAIQDQIASLDALSKKEQEESKSAELLQKAQELEFRARAEKDDYQRAELEKQANAARKDLEDYEKTLERAATKAELQSEIAQIKEIAEAQKAEALAQQAAITERYGALTSSGSLNAAATALLKGNKSDLVSLLASYNPDYFTNESTFASELGAALSASYLQSVLNGAKKQISAAVNPSDTSGASAGILARSVQIGEITINTSGASTAAEAQDLFEQFANKLADALS